jgi:hypothetical protein
MADSKKAPHAKTWIDETERFGFVLKKTFSVHFLPKKRKKT